MWQGSHLQLTVPASWHAGFQCGESRCTCAARDQAQAALARVPFACRLGHSPCPLQNRQTMNPRQSHSPDALDLHLADLLGGETEGGRLDASAFHAGWAPAAALPQPLINRTGAICMQPAPCTACQAPTTGSAATHILGLPAHVCTGHWEQSMPADSADLTCCGCQRHSAQNSTAMQTHVHAPLHSPTHRRRTAGG